MMLIPILRARKRYVFCRWLRNGPRRRRQSGVGRFITFIQRNHVRLHSGRDAVPAVRVRRRARRDDAPEQ